MCIILLAYHCHPQYKLIVAANRDEYYSRPSAPAQFWPDQPNIVAGRDLLQQGTWLGVTKQGRFAALTNYRDPAGMRTDAESRGQLVSRFLAGSQSSQEYLQAVEQEAGRYNGFNLLVGNIGDNDSLWYYSNRSKQISQVERGVSGLSNHLLNTPWPKVMRGRERLKKAVGSRGNVQEELMWQILTDRAKPDDAVLPQTGVTLELERILSPIFIESPGYGTRASTLLFVGYDGQVQFVERSLDVETECWHKKEYQFVIEKAAR